MRLLKFRPRDFLCHARAHDPNTQKKISQMKSCRIFSALPRKARAGPTSRRRASALQLHRVRLISDMSGSVINQINDQLTILTFYFQEYVYSYTMPHRDARDAWPVYFVLINDVINDTTQLEHNSVSLFFKSQGVYQYGHMELDNQKFKLNIRRHVQNQFVTLVLILFLLI